jgi:hypothetical protein
MEIEYMKRNYPEDWQTREMTSFDAKMAHMVNKIREKYKQIYETRPHTVLIEHKALLKQQEPPVKAPQQQEPPVKAPQQQEPHGKAPQHIEVLCSAITISTNKVCGRKAKYGGFCGLHCKKPA